MNKSLPTTSLTVVILNYNHSRFVLNPINSAIGQTQPFDEILIIDDASTDNSAALIQDRIRGVANARFIRNPQNLGVIASSNLGLNEAKSDFVYFMSADDNYSIHLVEWCREALRKYPDVALVAGNTRIHDVDRNKYRAFELPFPRIIARYERHDIEVIVRHRAFTFNVGANFIRRDAAIAAGGLNPELRWHCDWFLYFLLALRSSFANVPQEFVAVRQTNEQYSNACFDWPQQKPVIQAFVRTLSRKYPEEYDFFRSAGLLPTYDVESLLLAIFDPVFRSYLTPLLVWRLLTYKSFRAIGKLCPDSTRSRLRRLLRV